MKPTLRKHLSCISKLLLTFALIALPSLTAFAQESYSAIVVLKNGATIKGSIKQFDPAEKIVLNVGGFDTTIDMSNVSSVTNVANTQSPASENGNGSSETSWNLPEDTTVNICGLDVRFILMEGGQFKYGYDGWGSRAMESEPVHDVVLSPYYISEEMVSRDLYKAVMKTDYPTYISVRYADKKFEDNSLQECAFFMSEGLEKIKKIPSVENFMKALQSSVDEYFDLPTEVQWFYCESHMGKETMRLKTPSLLYCQFARTVSMADVQDPAGHSIVVKGSTGHANKGDFDTYRLYDRSQIKKTNIVDISQTFVANKKFEVSKFQSIGNATLCPIRLVMQVKQR